jgi:poly(3-hydroxyoctanoate) depolymerase
MLKVIISLVLMLGVLNARAANRSGCVVDSSFPESIHCPYQELSVIGKDITRAVKFGIPKGPAPKNGWPTVIIYQGSFFPVEFNRDEIMPFGGYNEIRLIKNLMDHGFAVIAPRALARVAWETNIIGVDYKTSEDFYFVTNLLKKMNDGEFGPLNMDKLFATGISSGGYNSSRMAVTFPGVFKALAIESASYATCGGPLCIIPEELPADHPPTFFLHGAIDNVVPVTTMLEYHSRLKNAGIPTEMQIDALAMHQWLSEAPELITQWFLKYSK